MSNRDSVWYCPQCSTKNNSALDRYCTECGSPSPLTTYKCPKCGERKNTARQHFCRNCGYNLFETQTKDQLLWIDPELKWLNTQFAKCAVTGFVGITAVVVLCALWLLSGNLQRKTIQTYLPPVVIVTAVAAVLKYNYKRTLGELLSKRYKECADKAAQL